MTTTIYQIGANLVKRCGTGKLAVEIFGNFNRNVVHNEVQSYYLTFRDFITSKNKIICLIGYYILMKNNNSVHGLKQHERLVRQDLGHSSLCRGLLM